MEVGSNNIAELLKHCEENGDAPEYVVQDETYKMRKSSLFSQSLPVRTKPVKYTSEGEEIFVISDLHIASGRNDAGVYPGTENFFADDSFKRFLQYAGRKKKTKNAMIIINGDVFDFLRVTEYPGKVRKARLSKRLKNLMKLDPIKTPALPTREVVENQFEEWNKELKKIGIKKPEEGLENSITKRERKFGLGTEDYKTIYKLMLIKKGHPEFFEALGLWMESGNKMVVVKGNHDLEIYWLAVRNYLRLIIAENIHNSKNTDTLEKILIDTVLPNINFIDDSVEIDKDFYVEHGHRYDKFAMVLDRPKLEKNDKQLNIPFGSFFNRYILNRVELFYPFLDNVRPSTNVLPMLMKENFPLGLKILFQHIPLLLRVLTTNFRYLRFMMGKVLLFALALVLPIAALTLVNLSSVTNFVKDFSELIGAAGIVGIFIEQVQIIFMIFLAYILLRLVAWFQLTEPSSLFKYAKERIKDTEYDIISMGHTHNPSAYLFDDGKRFYNTGTWIPIIETSTATVRKDRTFTFLHLIRDNFGKLKPAYEGLLQRWNDDADRPEALIILKRK